MSDLMEPGKPGPTSPKRQCTSKAKGTGTRCKRSPVPGAEVCVVHGGAAPQVRAKAAERLLTARIRGELAKVEIEPITDPAAAYADLAGEQWAFKELARQQIEVLESWASWSEGAGEQIKASVQVYTAALAQMQKTLADMLRIGLSAAAQQLHAYTWRTRVAGSQQPLPRQHVSQRRRHLGPERQLGH